MELDIQLINHNYIQRLIIFTVFMYKRYKGNPIEYNHRIQSYLDKVIPFKVDYNIVIPELSVDEKRDMDLESILNNKVKPYIIKIQFKSGYKPTSIQIDLSKEDEYEKFLYL